MRRAGRKGDAGRGHDGAPGRKPPRGLGAGGPAAAGGAGEPPAAVIDVEVQPRASRTEIVGWRDGRLRVRVAAPPVEGAANEALIAYLADRLDVPKRHISLIGGFASRVKRLRIDGLDRSALAARLAASPHS